MGIKPQPRNLQAERTDAGEKRHPPVSRRAVLLADYVSGPDDIDQTRPSSVIAIEPNIHPILLQLLSYDTAALEPAYGRPLSVVTPA
jgi:hypothetical protein